jgi:hypothetical protein
MSPYFKQFFTNIVRKIIIIFSSVFSSITLLLHLSSLPKIPVATAVCLHKYILFNSFYKFISFIQFHVFENFYYLSWINTVYFIGVMPSPVTKGMSLLFTIGLGGVLIVEYLSWLKIRCLGIYLY